MRKKQKMKKKMEKKNEKHKMKRKKGKKRKKRKKEKRKIADYKSKHQSLPIFFPDLPPNIFFLGSPPKWTYMSELNMPFSGRVSSFAEFLLVRLDYNSYIFENIFLNCS